MRFSSHACLSALAAVTILFAAPNALAAASKAMSGAACNPHTVGYGGGSTVDDVYRRADEQGYTNLYPTPTNATCDLVRDNSTNTTKPVDVYVRVTDNSTDYGFTCAVWSCSHLGSSCSSSTFSTSEAFTGPESINVPIPKSYYNGYYTVTCSVPPDSTIHSLYVYEPD